MAKNCDYLFLRKKKSDKFKKKINVGTKILDINVMIKKRYIEKYSSIFLIKKRPCPR